MFNEKKLQNKRKNVLKDDSAVSPMIATILLIAIVAVLGAVIAASSMKSAGNMETQSVTATLTAEQQAPGVYNITIIHDGGDQLTASALEFSVTNGENSAVVLENFSAAINTSIGPIISPSSVPSHFTAGSSIIFNGTTNSPIGTLTSGSTYHVLVMYNNKQVLLDTNVLLS